MLRRALFLVEMIRLPCTPSASRPAVGSARLCCVVGEVCCSWVASWRDNAFLALSPSPLGLKQLVPCSSHASCQVQVCLSVSLVSHNPLVVGGSLPSLPTLPAQPGGLRHWGSVQRSPVGSWIFFYRGDSSLEDPEDEGWHLELFSFLSGPHLLILSKEQGHRPVPTVPLSQ